MIRTIINFSRLTTHRQLSAFCQKAPKKKTLSDHPSLLNEEAIAEQIPEVYQQINEQAAQMEQQAIKAHKLKLQQLSSKISEQDISRLRRIDEIVSGLGVEEQEYLKLALIKNVEPIQ